MADSVLFTIRVRPPGGRDQGEGRGADGEQQGDGGQQRGGGGGQRGGTTPIVPVGTAARAAAARAGAAGAARTIVSTPPRFSTSVGISKFLGTDNELIPLIESGRISPVRAERILRRRESLVYRNIDNAGMHRNVRVVKLTTPQLTRELDVRVLAGMKLPSNVLEARAFRAGRIRDLPRRAAGAFARFLGIGSRVSLDGDSITFNRAGRAISAAEAGLAAQFFAGVSLRNLALQTRLGRGAAGLPRALLDRTFLDLERPFRGPFTRITGPGGIVRGTNRVLGAGAAVAGFAGGLLRRAVLPLAGASAIARPQGLIGILGGVGSPLVQTGGFVGESLEQLGVERIDAFGRSKQISEMRELFTGVASEINAWAASQTEIGDIEGAVEAVKDFRSTIPDVEQEAFVDALDKSAYVREHVKRQHEGRLSRATANALWKGFWD